MAITTDFRAWHLILTGVSWLNGTYKCFHRSIIWNRWKIDMNVIWCSTRIILGIGFSTKLEYRRILSKNCMYEWCLVYISRSSGFLTGGLICITRLYLTQLRPIRDRARVRFRKPRWKGPILTPTRVKEPLHHVMQGRGVLCASFVTITFYPCEPNRHTCS